MEVTAAVLSRAPTLNHGGSGNIAKIKSVWPRGIADDYNVYGFAKYKAKYIFLQLATA